MDRDTIEACAKAVEIHGGPLCEVYAALIRRLSPSHGDGEGWVLVPRQPTEAMWSGIARQIILWDRSANPRGETLYRQLTMTGCPIPDWLREEIPNTGQCPPKGTVAACIWKAMIDASPSSQGTETE
jgi:hypothetical protein